MNTMENKRVLWDIICEMNILREGHDKQLIMNLFEHYIDVVNIKPIQSVQEKNKHFLSLIIPIINILPVTDKELVSSRESFFEDRIQTIQEDKTPPLHNIFDPIDVHAELVYIKNILKQILEKLE
jgi:hypothetical protein